MAGHSKWANIKHRKAAQDSKRGKLYTRLIREITVAVRAGGSNAEDNPQLRLAVGKAVAMNMPRGTVDRAIARGAGSGSGGALHEITYEGYGPGGVAIMVSCLTDNGNRTVAEVRHAFGRYGGNLGAEGSVSYLFEKTGVIVLEPSACSSEKILDAALEVGAEDVLSHPDGSTEIQVPPSALVSATTVLASLEIEYVSAEVVQLPNSAQMLDVDTAEKVARLLQALEELSDTQEVYCNAEFPDAEQGSLL